MRLMLQSSLCWPSLAADISPPVQGVDHRRVQQELGDVVVNMHNPVVLSSTSVRVTWTVSSSLRCHLTAWDWSD